MRLDKLINFSLDDSTLFNRTLFVFNRCRNARFNCQLSKKYVLYNLFLM